MFKVLVLSTLFISVLFAREVVPDDYYISNDTDLSYIYAKEYQDILPSLKKYQQTIIDGYEKEFGYKLDTKLYVALASQNNQIPNGFATQIPFNLQMV
jgi:hypothetical protein